MRRQGHDRGRSSIPDQFDRARARQRISTTPAVVRDEK
jgi:hypothetical protein